MKSFLNAAVNYYPSKVSLGGGSLSFLAGSEMFLRALGDIKRLTNHALTLQERGVVEQRCSTNFGGAFFYLLMSANLVPYSAISGGLIFGIYSLVLGKDAPYVTASLVISVGRVIVQIVQPIFDYLLTPAFNHVVKPLAKLIGQGVTMLFRIRITESRSWIAVAALVVVIGSYHLALLLF